MTPDLHRTHRNNYIYIYTWGTVAPLALLLVAPVLVGRTSEPFDGSLRKKSLGYIRLGGQGVFWNIFLFLKGCRDRLDLVCMFFWWIGPIHQNLRFAEWPLILATEWATELDTGLGSQVAERIGPMRPKNLSPRCQKCMQTWFCV